MYLNAGYLFYQWFFFARYPLFLLTQKAACKCFDRLQKILSYEVSLFRYDHHPYHH